MNQDLARLGCVILLCLLAGLFIGNPFAWLALGLLVCLVRQQRLLRGIHRFLHTGDEPGAPAAPGIAGEIIRTIDARRAARKRREQELRELLLRFEEATEALPDAVVIMDTDKRIEWANTKAAEYLGVEFPRDQGQPFAHLLRQPGLLGGPADAGQPAANQSRIIRSPVAAGVSLETRLISYAGSSLLLVARNVTDIQRTNRMRKDFIANASHELRTPLTVIAGYLEAFDNDAEGPTQEWLPRIRQMRQQAGRMQNVVGDLLRLSRVEGGGAASLEHAVDMAGLLSSVRDEAVVLSGEQRHVISLETEPQLLLKGDKNTLYSAFSNIVFNAVQHTPARGSISIQWRQAGTGACLEVRDTGEGIAEEHLPRLTERFYRIDKGRSREKGGTGLGLAIVKHVIARHDAELVITSEAGKGTTVTCRFPQRRVILPAPVAR